MIINENDAYNCGWRGARVDKNDRPGDDGTLRSVQFMVFLLGVKDLASASAKRLLV